MEPDFSFRVRLSLAGGRQLPIVEQTFVLDAGDRQVVLRSAQPGDAPLCEAEIAVIRGSGYKSEQEAAAAGGYWRGVLERAFAATGIAADFGDRSMSNLTLAKAFAESFEREHGRPLLPDSPRLMVFSTHPEPALMASHGRVTVRGPVEPLMAAIKAARESDVAMTPRERTAYTYYSAAVGEQPSEAAFVLLMIAVEALIDQRPRSHDAVEFVDNLIDRTHGSALDDSTRRSLHGQLRRMKSQSIGEAGRELAATLGDRQYADMPPVRFFTRCYALRSRLVHMDAPGPDRFEVNTLLEPLRRFVSDLIAGVDLLAVVERVQGEIEAGPAARAAADQAQA